MAEVAETAVEMFDIILLLFEEGQIVEEELAALQAIRDTVGEVVADAMDGGESAGEATGRAYNTISDISDVAANDWAVKMGNEGIEVDGGYSKVEQLVNEELADTSPEASPDAGDDTGEPEDEEKNDSCDVNPESDACSERKKGSRWNAFKSWVKANAGLLLGATALAFVAIGAILRFVFWLWCKVSGECKGVTPAKKGTKPTSAQKKCCIGKTCDCDNAVTAKSCHYFKALVQFIRKYYVIMIVGIVVAFSGLAVYEESIEPLMSGGILALVIILMKTVFGTIASTAVCDSETTLCFFSGKGVNCRS